MSKGHIIVPMNPGAARWRTLEHTADLAIEVEAPTLPELYVTAGLGLTGLLQGRESGDGPGTDAADEAGRVEAWRELDLRSTDRPGLLVEWLRELLWIQSSEDVRFVTAEFEELGEGHLRARAAFQPLPDRSVIERELKGVTYHDLALLEKEGQWYARIVFDV